jgi:hypothetical protein
MDDMESGLPVSDQLKDHNQSGSILKVNTYLPLRAASKKGEAKTRISLCVLGSLMSAL